MTYCIFLEFSLYRSFSGNLGSKRTNLSNYFHLSISMFSLMNGLVVHAEDPPGELTLSPCTEHAFKEHANIGEENHSHSIELIEFFIYRQKAVFL